MRTVAVRFGAGIAILLLLWAMERAFVNMNRHIIELSSVAAIDRLQVVICSVIIGILLEGDKIVKLARRKAAGFQTFYAILLLLSLFISLCPVFSVEGAAFLPLGLYRIHISVLFGLLSGISLVRMWGRTKP
ncbi:hypothetical protein ABD76_00645 [Paenibacillus dendritiformis]|uniref:hypothetical protein n=1 Tax=Paenibacillus dendritiformis TaxID=130049 RepID=UPI0018CD4EB2|nr:hypothetical protein [Paenibacillus dendritiformis]MBG9791116.1 hypothetical protein [Paenibacillus dendritiformis]